MKPLNVNDLSLEQKIGMVLMGTTGKPYFDKNLERSLELIKNHALGTVWVEIQKDGSHVEYIKKIREAADYPLIITTDAENGYRNHTIGGEFALGMIDDTDATYRFALSLGSEAKRDGFSAICSPIIDPSGEFILGSVRHFGLDKEGVLRHAEAFIRGFHDAGIIAITKHFPSVAAERDTHMFEGHCDYTREYFVNECLYPYIELNKKGLLDGIMTGHTVVKSVDPDNPASISKKQIDILRDYGFDGVSITDDLSMLGICAKYGEERFFRAIKAGNDIALDFTLRASEASVRKAVEEGKLTEEELTTAAQHIINIQNKMLTLGNHTFGDADIAAIDEINRRSITEITDENTPKSIDKNGRHLFVLMTNEHTVFDENEEPEESDPSYRQKALAKHIKKKFPNSGVVGIAEYPINWRVMEVLHTALEYDDTVLVYYTFPQCYIGGESFTRRTIAMAESLVEAKRAHTLIYFGTPNVIKQLPHFERVIVGCHNLDNYRYCIDALAGEIEPKGKLPYPVKLN